MEKKTLRAEQTRRDDEVRRLNTASAKRYLSTREARASTGLIREVLSGVVFATTAVIVLVVVLAL